MKSKQPTVVVVKGNRHATIELSDWLQNSTTYTGKGWALVDPRPEPIEEKPIDKAGRPRAVIVVAFQMVIGGISRMVANWARRSTDKFDIHIVTPVAPCAGIVPEGIHVHLAPKGQEMGVISQLKPDVLVHHYPYPLHNYGLYAECPVIWIVHADQTLEAPRPNWCNPVAIFCNHIPEKLGTGWRADQLTCLPLGVDLDLFAPAKPKSLVAGIVGRVSFEKLPKSFFQALAGWNNGPWKIRIIGPEYLGHSITERMKAFPFVEYVGEVSPDKMPERYRELDALLVPSTFESGGYQIAEALASGLPVIARNVGGIPGTLGGAGILCDSDAAMLKELRSLDLPAVRAGWACAARKRAESAFDLGAHVAAHTRAIEAAIAGSDAESEPVVSIAMSVYNTRADWLREAVESIREQSLTDWECVIWDDGSTASETLDELRRIADLDRRFTVVFDRENRGVAAALNHAVALCRCPLIARMDSDDRACPDWLGNQVAYMREHPEAGCRGVQIEISKTHARTKHPANVTREEFAANGWIINHPGVIYRRSAFDAAGGYPSYRVAEDYGLWRRMLANGVNITNSQKCMVWYRIHDGQCTNKKNAREYRDNIAALKAAIPL